MRGINVNYTLNYLIAARSCLVICGDYKGYLEIMLNYARGFIIRIEERERERREGEKKLYDSFNREATVLSLRADNCRFNMLRMTFLDCGDAPSSRCLMRADL